MCGLAGIIAWDDRYRIMRDHLERMSARIAHRGPDGQGIWLNHESAITPKTPQVGLVHRRLAIIDPDPRADQPFTDDQGRWLVFNGEIYNYRELRKKLESLLPEYRWRTRSDTEVLLAAYAAWKEKCVDHLNGMYAFAIWDSTLNRLFLARDRMGQKPMYLAYAMRGTGCVKRLQWSTMLGDYGTPEPPISSPPLDAIAFASEPRVLLQLPWVDRQLNPAALAEYLQFGCSPAPMTIYAGISQMVPAVVAFCGRDCIEHPIPYFCAQKSQAAVPERALDDHTAIDRTRTMVNRAVERQLVSDVPLGCFLSGGVDSSVIAAAAQAALGSGQRLRTFSIGFDDPRYDESEYAAAVAKHLGTDHLEFHVRVDAAEDLPKLAATFGEPFGDSSALPTHYLSRETRQHVKVALSGDGGDELFAGYDRYRAIEMSQKLRWIGTPLLWRLIRPLVRLLPGVHPKSRWTRAKRLIESFGLGASRRYSSYLRLMDEGLIRRLAPDLPQLSDLILARDVAEAVFWQARPPGTDVLSAALEVDRLVYLPGDLLTKVDRCSMMHALEVRSPFMDHELVDMCIYLTRDQLLKGGPKRMLREAFADLLPEWVFKRKKMGFAVPIGQWFRDSLRPMLHDHLFAASSFARKHFNLPVVQRLVDEHQRQRADHSQRLYALLMLELWWKGQ